jgi:hypothetical protein
LFCVQRLPEALKPFFLYHWKQLVAFAFPAKRLPLSLAAGAALL